MSKELATQEDLLFDPKNLTKETIKKYLCATATDQELTMGLQIAKSFGLNPLKREIYFVKYGSNPMSVLTGYEVYLKRAERSGKYAGMRAWTEGSVEGKDLKGCVEVYVKGWEKPLIHEVDYTEYVQFKSDGTINKFWKTKPKTMIKKVAIAQGFRLAFPDETDGMPYTDAEVEEEIVDVQPNNGKSRIESIVDEAEIVAPKVTPPVQTKKPTPHPDPVAEVEKVLETKIDTVELKEGEKLAQGIITTPPQSATVAGPDGKPAMKFNFIIAEQKYGTFDKAIFEGICAIIDEQNKKKSNIIINIVYTDRVKGEKVFHDIVRFSVATINSKPMPI